MKILHAQFMAGIAGSETVLRMLLPALAARGHEVHFLCLHSPASDLICGAFCDELSARGVVTHRLQHQTRQTPRTLVAIDELVQRGGFDIVHTHLIRTDALFAASRMLFGRSYRLVSTKHGYDGDYMAAHGFDASKRTRNAYWWAAVVAERQMTASSCVSRGLATLVCDLGIVARDRQWVTPLGFDYPAPSQPVAELRYGNPQLVIVGRLVALKGQHIAIQAVARLVDEFPELSLVLVGGGDSEADLRSLTDQLRLTSHVVFAGAQPDPARYVAASDVALVPSTAEGFGLVVLEAMACQRPVVAFDVPAPNEIIVHGRTGLLARPYSVDDFTECVRRLLKDSRLRDVLGEGGLARLRGQFTLDAMTNGFEEFYEWVLTLTPRATWRRPSR